MDSLQSCNLSEAFRDLLSALLSASQGPGGAGDPSARGITCDLMLPQLVVSVGVFQGLDGGVVDLPQPLQYSWGGKACGQVRGKPHHTG